MLDIDKQFTKAFGVVANLLKLECIICILITQQEEINEMHSSLFLWDLFFDIYLR